MTTTIKPQSLWRWFHLALLLASLGYPQTLRSEAVLPATPTPALLVDQAWIRLVPPVARTSAAYLVLHNHSSRNLRLIGAATGIADSVELHATLEEQGMMKMRRQSSLELGAHARLEFAPGGLHLMLIGLKRPLRAHEQVSVTLLFEDGTSLSVQIPVQEGAAPR